MAANAQTLERIFKQAKQLPPDDRLLLVQRIIQSLLSPPASQQPHFLRYGEFKGDEASMSTWEDFALSDNPVSLSNSIK